MGLKRRQRVEPEFSLAAMIDVIFLLLMFFMLTSNFVTPNALNLQLPSSTSKSMASPALSVSVKADGTFYIENGEIKFPVKNFRFNESPIIMLNNLEEMGISERTVSAESNANYLLPALKIKDFTFTSLSDAV